MSAKASSVTPNIFAGATSKSTELEIIKEASKFVECLREAALNHDFSESVCSQRLRMWEEIINSPASE